MFDDICDYYDIFNILNELKFYFEVNYNKLSCYKPDCQNNNN